MIGKPATMLPMTRGMVSCGITQFTTAKNAMTKNGASTRSAMNGAVVNAAIRCAAYKKSAETEASSFSAIASIMNGR